MIHPVAELTQDGDGNAVFATVEPSYSPPSRSAVSKMKRYRLGPETNFFAREAATADRRGRRGERAETYYTRLWRYHHGWDDDQHGRRALKDKIAITQALAGALPVSVSERHEAVLFVRSHTGKRFNQYGGLPAMALGAFAAIRDETISARVKQVSDQLDNPLERRLSSDDGFIDICDQHDVDWYAASTKAKEIRNRE